MIESSLFKALERNIDTACRRTYEIERDDLLTDILNAKEADQAYFNDRLDRLDERVVINLSADSFCKEYSVSKIDLENALVALSRMRDDMDVLSYPDNSCFKGEMSVSSHKELQRFCCEEHKEGCYTLAMDLTKFSIKVDKGKTGVIGSRVFIHDKCYGDLLGKDQTLDRLEVLFQQEEGVSTSYFNLFDNAEDVTQDAFRKWKDRMNKDLFGGKKVVVLKGFKVYWTSKEL